MRQEMAWGLEESSNRCTQRRDGASDEVRPIGAPAAREISKMAESLAESSNHPPQGCDCIPASQAAPSEALRAARQEVADTKVEISNRLFEILADWDAQLQALGGIDELLAGDSFEAEEPSASDMDGGPVL